MTRDAEIDIQSYDYAKYLLFTGFPNKESALTAMRIAFSDGAKWADTNPHWISVDDELPPRWETNPNVSVPVITFGTLGESSIPFVELQRYHFGDGKWQYGKATHWMHFQYPKKGGDNG